MSLKRRFAQQDEVGRFWAYEVTGPGGRRYAEAAGSGFLRDQLLFGSSFPFRPMAQSVADFAALGLDARTSRQVLHGNAARMLGIKG